MALTYTFNKNGGTISYGYQLSNDCESSTVSFNITADAGITVTTSTTEIVISATENTGAARSATITPSVDGNSCGNEKSIIITQEKGEVVVPCTSSSAITAWGQSNDGTVGPCGGTVLVEIPYTAHTTYTGTNCPQDFDTPLISSFTVNITEVNCNEEPKTITGDHYKITQEAGPCVTCNCTDYDYFVSFPGETLELGACATSATLDVTATRKCVSPDIGEPVVYTPKVSWSNTGNENITISSTEGTAITVSATDNCVASTRDAVIGITASTQDDELISSTTISVTQNGGCDCECTTWSEQVWAEWYGYEYSGDSLISEVESCGGDVPLELNGHYRCTTITPSRYTDYSPRTIWEVVEGGEYVHLSSTNDSAITVSFYENDGAARQVKLAFSGFSYHDASTLALPAYPNVDKYVIIRQAAGPCEEQDTCSCNSITINAHNVYINYGSRSNIQLAEIPSECSNRFSFTSSTTSSENFITNLGISDGHLVCSVSENQTGELRLARITINFDGVYCDYVDLTQNAEPIYEFNVDFDSLSEGFEYNGNCNYTEYTVTVTSRMKVSSSASVWNWVGINNTFNKDLTNNSTLEFVEKPGQDETATTREYSVRINGCPSNTAVSNIQLTITQSETRNSSSETFNFRAKEIPTYEDIRLVPYITLEKYARPQGTASTYKHTLHFKSADNKRVGTTLYFMTGNADYFKVLPNGSSSCQQSTTCADYVVNRSELPSSGNKWMISPYDGEYDGLSTYENKDLVTTAFAPLPDCCEYTYQTNNINIYFGRSISDAAVRGTTGSPGDGDYLVDGNKRYWLDLSQQTNFMDPDRNNNFTYIEAFNTNNDISLASQVTFNTGYANEVSVSVYDDGVVFVDGAPEGAATVNQHFESITQFVNTLYPSGYEDIKACSFFDHVDIHQQQQCIDVKIEDGELVRDNNISPSSTRAIHIEQDKN